VAIREVPLFLEISQFPYDRKMSWISSAVLLQYLLVTDRQTDRQTQGRSMYRAGIAWHG